MKINISLQEDKELRNEVKNIIKGQVKKIIKEEISELVSKEFEQKENDSYNKKRVERMYHDGLVVSIRNEIGKLIATKEFCEEIIKPYAEDLIKKSIANMDIDSLVKDITKNMINKMVSKFK